MTKQLRQKVYEKYGGHCSYCGHEISINEMQVDHIKPQRLGGTDDFENLNPACRLCNHYKRAEPLESWRNFFLGGIIKRLRNVYIFKVAERYGMIEVKGWNKTFYFESVKLEEHL